MSTKNFGDATGGAVKGRVNVVFIVEAMLCAVAAVAVLSTWRLHPVMSGEMEEAGRWLVGFLIAGVLLAAAAAVLLARDAKPRR